jgi:hypothetical protein
VRPAASRSGSSDRMRSMSGSIRGFILSPRKLPAPDQMNMSSWL